MGRHLEKLHPSEPKYNAMDLDLLRNPSTIISTIKHRERGRRRTRLNAAKFEARRTGDGTAYIQAGVNEMMRILGV